MRTDLWAVGSQRYALEVLDQLDARAMSVPELSAALSCSRRTIGRALRALAVDGLVTADGIGSWDSGLPRSTRYRLTRRGRLLVDRLSSFATWESL